MTRASAGTLSFVTGIGSRPSTARSFSASMSASTGPSVKPGLGTAPWHAPQNAKVSLGHGEKPNGIWRTGVNLREPTDPRPRPQRRGVLLQRQAVDVRLRDDVAVGVEQHHDPVDRDARQEADDARVGEHEVREREDTGIGI